MYSRIQHTKLDVSVSDACLIEVWKLFITGEDVNEHADEDGGDVRFVSIT